MMLPPKPKAAFFPLRIEVVQGAVVVGTPRSLYIKRGLLGVFALPPLLFLLLLVLFMGFVAESTESVELGFTIALCTLSGLSIAWGLILMLGSGALARRTRVRFDRARRVVRRERDGLEIPWDAVATVRAGPCRGGRFGWWAIELVGQGDAVVMSIHDRLASQHAADIEATARSLGACLADPGYRRADAIGVDVPEGASRVDAMGLTPNTAAMLCYLPIQGIFLVASIYYAITARDRPFVRFAALQSLVQVAASSGVLIVIVVSAGAPIALLDDGPTRVVAIVLLVVLLVGFLVWNLGAHIYAASQAHKGKVWVMPWLRPIVQRWAPPR
jgi:uncharacterized membrane protein